MPRYGTSLWSRIGATAGSTFVRQMTHPLASYERRSLLRDGLAGITVAAYLVPQVMGYASVAGLPVVAGLWGLVAALSVYILAGSSPQLSVGPESIELARG